MSRDRSTKESASVISKVESAPRQNLDSCLPTLSAKEERWRREAIEEAARMGIIERPSHRSTNWKVQQQFARGAVRPNPKPGSKPRKLSRVIIPQRSRKMIMSALSVPRYYKSRTASDIKSLKRKLKRRRISRRKVERKKMKSKKRKKQLKKKRKVSSSDSLSTSESLDSSSSHTSSCASSSSSSSSLTDRSSSEYSSPNRRKLDNQSYHKSRSGFVKMKTTNLSSSSGLSEKLNSGSDDENAIAKNDQPVNNISLLKQKQSSTSSYSSRSQPLIESKGEAEKVSLKPEEKQTTYIDNKLDGHLLTSTLDGFKRSPVEGERDVENLKTEPLFAVISSTHSPPTVPITSLRKLPVGNVLQTRLVVSDLGPNKPFPKLF